MPTFSSSQHSSWLSRCWLSLPSSMREIKSASIAVGSSLYRSLHMHLIILTHISYMRQHQCRLLQTAQQLIPNNDSCLRTLRNGFVPHSIPKLLMCPIYSTSPLLITWEQIKPFQFYFLFYLFVFFGLPDCQGFTESNRLHVRRGRSLTRMYRIGFSRK